MVSSSTHTQLRVWYLPQRTSNYQSCIFLNAQAAMSLLSSSTHKQPPVLYLPQRTSSYESGFFLNAQATTSLVSSSTHKRLPVLYLPQLTSDYESVIFLNVQATTAYESGTFFSTQATTSLVSSSMHTQLRVWYLNPQRTSDYSLRVWSLPLRTRSYEPGIFLNAQAAATSESLLIVFAYLPTSTYARTTASGSVLPGSFPREGVCFVWVISLQTSLFSWVVFPQTSLFCLDCFPTNKSVLSGLFLHKRVSFVWAVSSQTSLFCLGHIPASESVLPGLFPTNECTCHEVVLLQSRFTRLSMASSPHSSSKVTVSHFNKHTDLSAYIRVPKQVRFLILINTQSYLSANIRVPQVAIHTHGIIMKGACVGTLLYLLKTTYDLYKPARDLGQREGLWYCKEDNDGQPPAYQIIPLSSGAEIRVRINGSLVAEST